MTTASIRVTPGQAADSLAFRANSALAHCTNVDGDDAGVFIERRWPSLSTGEELLWRVLAWLNGAHDLPSREDLAAGLDGPNFAAAMAAINIGVTS